MRDLASHGITSQQTAHSGPNGKIETLPDHEAWIYSYLRYSKATQDEINGWKRARMRRCMTALDEVHTPSLKFVISFDELRRYYLWPNTKVETEPTYNCKRNRLLLALPALLEVWINISDDTAVKFDHFARCQAGLKDSRVDSTKVLQRRTIPHKLKNIKLSMYQVVSLIRALLGRRRTWS